MRSRSNTGGVNTVIEIKDASPAKVGAQVVLLADGTTAARSARANSKRRS
jgi:hypothetical protein